MNYEWIVDVLSDLRAFAQNNGLTRLAEQLDDTALVAATEIALRVEAPGEAAAYGDTDRGPHRSLAGSDLA